MLDNFPIHIDDVEIAVGCIRKGDRAKPIVSRDEEFAPLFVRGAFRFPAHTISTEFFPMNEVAAAVRNKRITVKLFGPRVAPVNRDARRASEVAGRTTAAFDGTGNHSGHAPLRADDAPRFVRADTKNFGGRSIGGDAHVWRWQ